MYKIIAYDTPDCENGELIFDTNLNKHIADGKLTLKESEIDDFQLEITQEDSLFNKIVPFKTHIEIQKNDKIIFRGRALKPTKEMSQEGLFSQTYSFESISSYLLDSIQRFREVKKTTPAKLLKILIDNHNSQVSNYKKFKLGNVNVNSSISTKYIEYDNTFDSITKLLIEDIGGYLRVRYKDGINYIDYLKGVGRIHENDNSIALGKNLKTSSVDIDPTAVITRLIPLGATIENNSNRASNPKLTIASVNKGKDYIDILNLQSEFGIINGVVEWSEVKKANELLSLAKKWINKQPIANEQWSISALELGIENFEDFNVSDSYLFDNKYLSEKQYLRIVQKEIDMNSPYSSTLTIGNNQDTLSSYQNNFNKTSKKVNELKTYVDGQVSDVNSVKESISELTNKLELQDSLINKINSEIAEFGDDIMNYKNKQDLINENVETRLINLEGSEINE